LALSSAVKDALVGNRLLTSLTLSVMSGHPDIPAILRLVRISSIPHIPSIPECV
jgi:hypothetical protein